MKLLTLTALVAIASAHLVEEAPTTTEVLTKYVFTCPCDASRSVSIGTTYVNTNQAEASWYGWNSIASPSGTTTSKGSVSTSKSLASYSTTSLSNTTTSSQSSQSSTSTISSTTISSTITSPISSSTSTTTATSTSSSFIIVATTSPQARIVKRATLYLAFNATGYSYLTSSPDSAQGLTTDPNGLLVTTGIPAQYVAFSNSDPQLLQLRTSRPASPVTVTANSDGTLTINNVASQCQDNSSGGSVFVVVQNGGNTSTPDGCIPVTLGSQAYVAVTYSSTCTTATTTVRPVTTCTIYQLAGGSTRATTICTSSTSTSVAGPGTTLSAVAQGCQTITSTATSTASG